MKRSLIIYALAIAAQHAIAADAKKGEQLAQQQCPACHGKDFVTAVDPTYPKLAGRRGDEHAAAHAVMDCLGEAVWAAQRSGSPLPPDEMTARYLECLEREAGAD